jgi:outer membrane protein assembly factor BamA
MRRRGLALVLLALASCAAPPASPHMATPRPKAARVTEPPRPRVSCSTATTSPPSLGEVVLRGTDEASACEKLRSTAGAPLDEARVTADIHTLHASGFFEDVTAVIEEDDARPPTLVFEVKERPRIASLSTRGAPDGVDVRGGMGSAPVRYDPFWVRATDARIADSMHEAGYRKATVGHEVTPTADGAVTVVFAIVPGARSVLGAVRFEGLTTAPVDRLRAVLALTPGEPAPEMMVERDTLMVQSALFDLGLVQSEVKPRIEENFLASRFDVVFVVTEGPAYRLGVVKVSGERLLPKDRYAKLLATLPRGTLFVRSKVAAVVQTVERMHHDAGADRIVDVRTTVDPKRHTIDVDLHVD